MAITSFFSCPLSVTLPSSIKQQQSSCQLKSSCSSSSSSSSCFDCKCCHHHHQYSLSTSNTIASRALLDIQESGIIACLRAQSAELALEAARAALSAGVSALEIVISTPGVFEVLRQLVRDYPTAAIGVGTVLNARDAKDAITCGVKFIMSPAMVMGILDDVLDSQALYIPGAMTPTEILSAFNAGAKIVKVYPVSALGGIEYIAALKKPFSHIPLVASQGITIGEYIAQGASAVVLSDAIFDKKAMNERNFNAIHQLAHLAASRGREAVKSASEPRSILELWAEMVSDAVHGMGQLRLDKVVHLNLQIGN